ncbi:MAG: hypothetical protein R2911_44875 [Caldilineaceae bacterium]
MSDRISIFAVFLSVALLGSANPQLGYNGTKITADDASSTKQMLWPADHHLSATGQSAVPPRHEIIAINQVTRAAATDIIKTASLTQGVRHLRRSAQKLLAFCEMREVRYHKQQNRWQIQQHELIGGCKTHV